MIAALVRLRFTEHHYNVLGFDSQNERLAFEETMHKQVLRRRYAESTLYFPDVPRDRWQCAPACSADDVNPI
jgi:hypothetical protein